jgi:N-acetylmuramoyl-L-alanine amidase
VDSEYYFKGKPTGNFQEDSRVRSDLSGFIAAKQSKTISAEKKGGITLNKPEYIIVHISDSTWGTAREIRKWHLERGWKDIGYHYVILNGQLSTNFNLPVLNGSIEVARWWEEEGAHCIGYNSKSVSICGIAKEHWTPQQEASLIQLCKALCKQFNIKPENILGHGETASGKAEGKTCPNLDMKRIREIVKGEMGS